MRGKSKKVSIISEIPFHHLAQKNLNFIPAIEPTSYICQYSRRAEDRFTTWGLSEFLIGYSWFKHLSPDPVNGLHECLDVYFVECHNKIS